MHIMQPTMRIARLCSFAAAMSAAPGTDRVTDGQRDMAPF